MKSISRIIEQLAFEAPEAPAVTCKNKSISRYDLEHTTNQLARAYIDIGVRQGDLVTIALPNSIEFYQVCIALWKIGATPQPVSSKLPDAELRAIIELAKPTLIIGCDDLEYASCPCRSSGGVSYDSFSGEVLPDIVSRYWKVMTSGGSTGRPKLIVSHISGEFNLDEPSDFRQKFNQTQLVPGPLYHNAPFLFSMEGLFRGHHLVIMKKFVADECIDLLEKYKANWTFLVPTMMQRIWKLGDAVRENKNLKALDVVLHTAGPCATWLKEAWIDWLGGEHVHELYGGTEATGITWITGVEWLSHRGSVGKTIRGSSLKIVDGNGNNVPAGTVGEIYLLPEGGQGSTYHYIGDEAKALTGGWESLGDMGYLDSYGYLYLADRKKDLIISGGANIYPAEVEAAIDSHPAVLSCAVTGVPHEDLGQVVHGVVESDATLTQTALLDYLATRLVRYKIPRTIDFVNKPVRSDAGKVRRSELNVGAAV